MDDVVQVKHDAHPLPVRIKQLSNSVINKIAAGEVIERPASIVKELLENAIDADASRIDVQVANGGTDLIQVTDDGCGIHCDDLNLAVASHATSKIRDADDLFDVKSLGFRGEALASIAEISRFRLQSRTVDSECAYELEVQGGQLCDIRPCAGPVGTTVVVEQLFFNTPVRRKFLKTSQTEFGHVAEAFTRIALANPGVHFTLKHNEKLVYDLPAVLNWESRIAGFFGHELGEALIPVSSEIDGVSLAGFVVDPLHSRAHNRMQYLFLNGRCIRDRSLQHALSEAYRGLLLSGRQPICFLKLSMEADRVDVNVHPCKLEVRFQDGSRIYSQLLGTIRNKFLTTDLTARQNLQNLDDPSGTAAARNHAVGQTAIKSPPLPSGEAWTSSELGPNPQQRKLGLPAQKFDYDWTSGPRNPNAAQPSGNFQAQALPSADQLSGMPYSA
ncbi:MAG TPA: DNA mismatch repair endonuclease MutL, partial [Pirellulaceae bacterium]|nr:DNA mismatch repair endonuclease MutL [Pirellulaceae bacterium]